MKKINLNIFVALFAAVVMICVLSGCRKASDNGKLDGQWQIMKIENVATGEEMVPPVRKYICLNLHVVQLTGNGQAFGNMHYDKDKGIINWDFPKLKTEDEIATLQSWGLYSNPVTLEVVKLDGSQMVLKTPETVITCRRF